jgi:hypothetical protein
MAMAAAVTALLIEPRVLYVAVGMIGLAGGGALPLVLAPGTAAVWGLGLTVAKRAEDLTPS